MANRTAAPTDDAGKSARSFRLHLADAWNVAPKCAASRGSATPDKNFGIFVKVGTFRAEVAVANAYVNLVMRSCAGCSQVATSTSAAAPSTSIA